MRQENQGRENNLSEMKKLGAQLRALREAQGLSYEDVAAVTHVRPHVIKSMESGTIDETVPSVYARGFMKTYCEYLMAGDLWRKYCLGIPQSDESEDEFTEEAQVVEQIQIKHPTPIFRRSSIIWVYIILVIAVTGAAYLLWSQSRQPGGTNGAFPLNQPLESVDIVESIIVISEDETISDAPPLEESVSPDVTAAQDPPNEDVTEPPDEAAAIPAGDLSWMEETATPPTPVAEIPQPAQLADRTLLIEITGSNTRLIVEQGGTWVTRRLQPGLAMGSRRTYTVDSDTRVTLGAGNRARVTWAGQRYDSIGSDNQELILIFHPDGSVTVESGNSPHFRRETP